MKSRKKFLGFFFKSEIRPKKKKKLKEKNFKAEGTLPAQGWWVLTVARGGGSGVTGPLPWVPPRAQYHPPVSGPGVRAGGGRGTGAARGLGHSPLPSPRPGQRPSRGDPLVSAQ